MHLQQPTLSASLMEVVCAPAQNPSFTIHFDSLFVSCSEDNSEKQEYHAQLCSRNRTNMSYKAAKHEKEATGAGA